jgi:hypothetical protein
MRTATTIVLLGIVLLFLGSMFFGPKVFSSYERSLDESVQTSQANQMSPEAAEAARKRAEFRKARLALSSFDLLAGFTNRELEAIPSYSRTFSFFFMLACFWLILGLRKPERD